MRLQRRVYTSNWARDGVRENTAGKTAIYMGPPNVYAGMWKSIPQRQRKDKWFFNPIFLFFYLNYLFILLYNIVLVLPYIDLNPPWVYVCFPSWTPLPTPYPIPLGHPSAPASSILYHASNLDWPSFNFVKVFIEKILASLHLSVHQIFCI